MQSNRDEDKQKIYLPLGLPRNIFQEMISFVDSNKDYHSIETIRALASLSSTCPSMYGFFKPELDKRLSLLALTRVLQGNEELAVKLAKSQPKVFFIKGTARDYATDLAGNPRIIKEWSAYQAMFGVVDVDLLKVVKPLLDAYLATLPNGKKIARDQEQEKFPNGFECPVSTYDFNQIVQAITYDQQLINKNKPSDLTLAVIAQFRTDFKPGVVTSGYHFNLSDYVKAHAIYDQKWTSWNSEQLSFFSLYVIGFLQRLLPAPYMQRACQGLNNREPLKRSYKSTKSELGRNDIVLFPLDTDSTYRLGDDCFVDSYYGQVECPSRGGSFLSESAGRHLVDYVKRTQQSLQDLCTGLLDGIKCVIL